MVGSSFTFKLIGETTIKNKSIIFFLTFSFFKNIDFYKILKFFYDNFLTEQNEIFKVFLNFLFQERFQINVKNILVKSLNVIFSFIP